MAGKYLGDAFDFHGGGLDLRFPHHENELAQSTAAGRAFAGFWLHNGMVTYAGDKMSKSIGNTISPAQMLAEARPLVVRYFLGQAHYRSVLDYRPGSLPEAAAAIDRIETFITRAQKRTSASGQARQAPAAVPEDFGAAMDDDLNVPAALAVLHETVRSGNTALDEGDDNAAAAALASVTAMVAVLGIDPTDERWGGGAANRAEQTALETLVADRLAERDTARKERDFGRADAIRDSLSAAGVVVEDAPDGAAWSLQRGARR